MTQPWYHDLIGLPYQDNGYTERGVSCWGLVHLAFLKKTGVFLTTFSETLETSPKEVYKRFKEQQGLSEWIFIKPGMQQALDVVLMTGWFTHENTVYSRPVHCGILVERNSLLHVEQGKTSVVLPFGLPEETHKLIRHRIVAVYRHNTQC